MASFTDDISFNTMVGPGAFVTGDLKLEGFTRVDGDIYGNLETTGKLIIGENARIRGSLTAKSVIVIGIVEGDILAPEGIHLFSSAVVLGDVISRKVKAEENVVIEGYCISIENPQEFEDAKKQWLDMRAISNKNYFGKVR
ncbi:MAG: polymer-forming cytoskeletal protein [Treponemataceae bacterium]|jgi:cytoskeletal protein CcmA (bactofilin family)|nr:polymer-forming cytoskeletal protein [Spirochaetaceae bacterium]MEE0879171.1 polymer-forming cytoskeletal protein [Treponemataceae bacterium]